MAIYKKVNLSLKFSYPYNSIIYQNFVVLGLLGTTSSVYPFSLTSDITSSTDIVNSIEPTNEISNGKN